MITRVAAAAGIVSGMGLPNLFVVVLVLGGATFLSAIGKVDAAAPIGIYTAVLGYVFGASRPDTSQAGS